MGPIDRASLCLQTPATSEIGIVKPAQHELSLVVRVVLVLYIYIYIYIYIYVYTLVYALFQDDGIQCWLPEAEFSEYLQGRASAMTCRHAWEPHTKWAEATLSQHSSSGILRPFDSASALETFSLLLFSS
jgi:hypothetical protein